MLAQTLLPAPNTEVEPIQQIPVPASHWQSGLPPFASSYLQDAIALRVALQSSP